MSSQDTSPAALKESGVTTRSGATTGNENLPREAGANVAKTSNPNSGVGGTAQDGGLSTAATAADGGPDASKKDAEYKPS